MVLARVEKRLGLPSLDKVPEVVDLIKTLDSIHAKKLEQILEILTLVKELQQTSGSEGLGLAVELVRLVGEIPDQRIKQLSLLLQRAERMAKSPEAKKLLEAVKE